MKCVSLFSKGVLLVLFTILLSNRLSARVYSTCPYPQHEWGVGYGFYPTEQLAITFLEEVSFGVLKPLTNMDFQSSQFVGPISVNYKHFFKERLAVGVSALYSNAKVKFVGGNEVLTTSHLNTISVLPRFDFYYLRNPKFAMYGSLAAGAFVMVANGKELPLEDKANVSFAFQVTPLAFRIGRDFGLVVELGIGSHGLAEVGFTYRPFHRPWMH
ncbi:MAG: hypothetical protein LC105_06600 [Chitinophagales bacterium]|nr:hypothetical protein [Chitinophagales bacterium]MCZ2393505.1 hypothetical protein [Chitinophagales bacterium]